MLADVEAEYDLERGSMHTFFSGDGVFLLFPLPGDRVRVIAETTSGGPEPTLASVQALADARADDIRLTAAHWLATFEVHYGQVRLLPPRPRVPGR